MPRMWIRGLLAALILGWGAHSACADVVTQLPPHANADKRIALTFDACQAHQRVRFDQPMLDYLIRNRIPFTVFVTGRFARDNAADLWGLSQLDFVEIANHSWDHPNHMDRMAPSHVVQQVERAAAEISAAIGRPPAPFFRFPAGVYDADALAAVEAFNYRVVHWRWAVGDPDISMTAHRIKARVAAKAQPDDILIFHINGRGWHTGEALPDVIDDLRGKGFRFVTLSEGLNGAPVPAAAQKTPAPQEGGVVNTALREMIMQILDRRKSGDASTKKGPADLRAPAINSQPN